MEEVGIRFTTEDEQAFYNAIAKAEAGITDFDRALAKMAQQQENAAMLDRVKTKLEGMTEAEKFTAIEAVKLADATTEASGHVKDVGDQGEKSAGVMDKLKGVLNGVGTAIVGAFAVNKIGDFIKSTITAASDLNETISKSRVVFGDASKAVESMGNTAATSMGMSKDAAIAAAATYGNLFTSMGMGADVSADMSVKLVKLAGDFASFNNIPVADALEKIRAGLVGESEPLKSLGVNINEAALKQEAMNLKLFDGNGVLDAATKAQAAYSLMLKQSASAQGDFARTADGAANQTRILQAQAEDLKAALGDKLLPVWRDVLLVANGAATTFNTLVNFDNMIIAAMIEHNDVMKKSAPNWEVYISEMQRSAKAAGLLIDAEGNLVQLQDNGMGASTKKIIVAHFAMTQSQYDYTQEVKTATVNQWDYKASLEATKVGTEGMKYILDKATVSMFDYASSAEGAAAHTASLKAGVDALSKAYQAYLSSGMSIYSSNKEYAQSFWGIQNGIVTLTQGIDVLSKLKYRTPEQEAALAGMREDLGKQKTALQELEDKHTEVTKTMIFNMLLQKAASNGLTTVENDNLLKIAKSWGMIDDATYNSAKALNGMDLDDANLKLSTIDGLLQNVATSSAGAAGAYAMATDKMNAISLGVARGELAPINALLAGQMTNSAIAAQSLADATARMNEIKLGVARGELAPIDALLRSIMGQPNNKTVTVNTYHNDYWNQSPSSPTVAPGKPYDPTTDPTVNGLMGDLFNSTVRAIGSPASIANMQNNSYQNANNYNLQVMTNQSPAVVQQSFEMMRLLA